MIAICVHRLFSKTEGLAHHTRALGHCVVVDFYVERIDEISETGAVFGSHVFPLFEDIHLFVNFFNKQFKFVFIAGFPCVKFDDSFFESNY